MRRAGKAGLTRLCVELMMTQGNWIGLGESGIEDQGSLKATRAAAATPFSRAHIGYFA